MKTDTYQMVTDKIIADLEGGTPTWCKPWKGDGGIKTRALMPTNLKTGKAYRGINPLMLWGLSHSNYFLTYKQAIDLGGNVKKKEKAIANVVYWSMFGVKDKVTGKDKQVGFMKHSPVFAYEQCENLKPLQEILTADETIEENHARADELLEQADIEYGGDRACYIPKLDKINMPIAKTFNSTEDYYSTALHELTHWTKHKSRLDRDMQSYAKEELVAELGSAYLCASLNIEKQGVDLQHASYIKSWLQALKDDKKFIFQAAKFAQKASDFIQGITYEQPTKGE